ncbi:hypothetical protein [Streptomyces sp. NPDC002962]|uniref:hypothetical protein n=1 Tax=Streptomyces sp. NPDC002962 TaxID=3364674 RepID=UPI003675FF63
MITFELLEGPATVDENSHQAILSQRGDLQRGLRGRGRIRNGKKFGPCGASAPKSAKDDYAWRQAVDRNASTYSDSGQVVFG